MAKIHVWSHLHKELVLPQSPILRTRTRSTHTTRPVLWSIPKNGVELSSNVHDHNNVWLAYISFFHHFDYYFTVNYWKMTNTCLSSETRVITNWELHYQYNVQNLTHKLEPVSYKSEKCIFTISIGHSSYSYNFLWKKLSLGGGRGIVSWYAVTIPKWSHNASRKVIIVSHQSSRVHLPLYLSIPPLQHGNKFQAIRILTTDGGEWPTSCSNLFTIGVRALSTHWIGGWELFRIWLCAPARNQTPTSSQWPMTYVPHML
jgi:hypothetical protein